MKKYVGILALLAIGACGGSTVEDGLGIVSATDTSSAAANNDDTETATAATTPTVTVPATVTPNDTSKGNSNEQVTESLFISFLLPDKVADLAIPGQKSVLFGTYYLSSPEHQQVVERTAVRFISSTYPSSATFIEGGAKVAEHIVNCRFVDRTNAKVMAGPVNPDADAYVRTYDSYATSVHGTGALDVVCDFADTEPDTLLKFAVQMDCLGVYAHDKRGKSVTNVIQEGNGNPPRYSITLVPSSWMK